jgi:L-asparaginase II
VNCNPILVEVTRGGIVESRHRGSFVVSDASGNRLASAGDMTTPIFPRSAFKAFQCVPLIESGAADHFGLSDAEIALCCASHNGEPQHVQVAASILAKAGHAETQLECGAHWPHEREDVVAQSREAGQPRAIHNVCSGKHAGMLALAKHLGVPAAGYVKFEHPVQRGVADTLTRFCEVDIATAPMGIDGCSVPTWAMPLPQMALGFARLAAADCAAGRRIIGAVRAHPMMIEGKSGFDSIIMAEVPGLFLKYGAEAVYCGVIAHAGLGFALKIDDGAKRAAQVAIAGVLAALEVWTTEERSALEKQAALPLRNWRGIKVGDIRCSLSWRGMG